jgi:hypothetical protein
MPSRKDRIWLAVFAVIVVAAGGLMALRRSCDASGGEFRWSQLSCSTASRPIILQGDIHRV